MSSLSAGRESEIRRKSIGRRASRYIIVVAGVYARDLREAEKNTGSVGLPRDDTRQDFHRIDPEESPRGQFWPYHSGRITQRRRSGVFLSSGFISAPIKQVGTRKPK
jgi:hypothetical protein